MDHSNIIFTFLLLFLIDFFNSEQPPSSTTTVGLYNTIEFSNVDRIMNKPCIPLDESFVYIAESIKRRKFLYKLNITGMTVRFSEIPATNYCPGITIIIQIFASEKIIIDQDYNSEGIDVTLVLIAPIWEVVGDRKIILNGYDGLQMHEKLKAEDGNPDGNRNGADGKEGFPGGPAGDFHGITETIINRSHLKIEANGGRGGPGQNGGNGAIGKSGTKFNLSTKLINFNGDVEGFSTILRREISSPRKANFLGKGISEVVLGEQGTNGGSGGNGGRGGKGGYAGVITLFELKKNCTQEMLSPQKNGTDGKDGIGGEGGNGGNPGTDVYLKIYFPNRIIKTRNSINNVHSLTSKGENGENGSKFARKMSPDEHNPDLQTFQESVTYFYEFVMPYFNNYKNEIKVIDFSQKMHDCKISSYGNG